MQPYRYPYPVKVVVRLGQSEAARPVGWSVPPQARRDVSKDKP